jgi:hypothetical protein
MKDYIIENIKFSNYSSFEYEGNSYLSILPPQRRSVLISKDGGKTKLIKINFPELVFVYYQLTSAQLYIPKLRVLEFYEKKKNILDSVVAPIVAPNCYEDSQVCLGSNLVYKSKIDNLKDYILDKFFNAVFNYNSFNYFIDEKDSFKFKCLYYRRNPLRNYIPTTDVNSISLKRINNGSL